MAVKSKTVTKSNNSKSGATAANMMKPTTATTKRATPSVVSHDQIAARAYGIYLSGKGGSPVDHWLQAERELRSTSATN